MAGLTVIPKYPIEWWRFVRSPASYVEGTRALDQKDVYEPWAAFGVGVGLTVALFAYEARRSSSHLDQGTEQVFLFIIAALNLVIVHALCRAMGGKASLRDLGAAFEYLYGFLVPATVAGTSVSVAATELISGADCRVTLDTFECNLAPSATAVVTVTLLQTALIAMAIYVFVVFN